MNEIDILLDSIKDVRRHQDNIESKVDNIKDILLEYCDRTERVEEKISTSLMIPKWVLKIGGILTGIPAFIAGIIALFKS